MPKSSYTWGKASSNGKKKKRGSSGIKSAGSPRVPKAGLKKVKQMKTGY